MMTALHLADVKSAIGLWTRDWAALMADAERYAAKNKSEMAVRQVNAAAEKRQQITHQLEATEQRLLAELQQKTLL